MKKTIVLLYGLICYTLFLGTFVYAIGFVGNIYVPVTIDGNPSESVMYAIITDAGLLLLFALQHSIMARPAFKAIWTKLIPEPSERSTYVLLSSLCMLLMMWKWQPIGGIIWKFDNPLIQGITLAVFGLGWAIVLVSTFLINHFDLFGLRQVWLYFTGKDYVPLKFRTPFFYKYVRHPLYFGWLLCFWATPTMSISHLLFAILTTGYIFSAIWFEEKDLTTHFGNQYRNYKSKTPMIFPNIKKKSVQS